jgi:hypothetical protein
VSNALVPLIPRLTIIVIQRTNAGFVYRIRILRVSISLSFIRAISMTPFRRKHLIVAIGGECYVTLPKGQIIPPEAEAVPGGGHVLIIPISHHPTFSTIPPDLALPILEETEK